MRLVCSYCRKVIRHEAGSRISDVSHGMCGACAAHHDVLWKGKPLTEYVAALPEPVMVLDGDARVVAANRRLTVLFGDEDARLRGLPCGDAFGCVHSRLREGCGGTTHCRECTVRRVVTRVHESGKPLRHVPVWLRTRGGRVDMRISARRKHGLVKLVVEGIERRPSRR